MFNASVFKIINLMQESSDVCKLTANGRWQASSNVPWFMGGMGHGMEWGRIRDSWWSMGFIPDSAAKLFRCAIVGLLVRQCDSFQQTVKVSADVCWKTCRFNVALQQGWGEEASCLVSINHEDLAVFWLWSGNYVVNWPLLVSQQICQNDYKLLVKSYMFKYSDW